MSTIAKNVMYVCSFEPGGKWNVRKVNKVTSETEKTYTVAGEKCDCEQFKAKAMCKHVEMVKGRFSKSKTRPVVGKHKDDIINFLEGYIKGHFDSRLKIAYAPENGDISERFNVLCEADEKKILWASIMTPVETETGKGLPVLVRVIFTDDFDKNLSNF